jgi:hypothetical protein
MSHHLEPEPHYEETTDPHNPPAAVVKPQARTAALVTFLGGIILFFVLFGAALLFWTITSRTSGDELREPAAVGTSGERFETKPGGFDPAPEHGSTSSELEYRGVDEPTTGPMPGLTSDNEKNPAK